MNDQDRMDAALAGMKAEGLEMVIAFSNAAHHIEKPEAIALLSGLKPMGPSAVVLEVGGNASLIVTPAWDAPRAARISHTQSSAATDDLGEALSAMLKGKLPPVDRIGVVALDVMAQSLAAQVLDLLGGEPKNAGKLIFGTASIKTDEEMEYAIKATEIAERGYEHMLEICKPGMSECELALRMRVQMKSIGADDNFLMLHGTDHPLAVQPSGERVFVKGDLILAEITPSYKGQFAQVCRTAALGTPTDEQVEKYDLVVRAMKKGIEAARPGAAMKEVCLAIDEVLGEAGYANYCQPPYMNRRGHGLGISCTIPGNVSLDNEIILEDGMFFVVHPNQYIPEVGYLLCGEPIAITADGARRLSGSWASLGSIQI